MSKINLTKTQKDFLNTLLDETKASAQRRVEQRTKEEIEAAAREIKEEAEATEAELEKTKQKVENLRTLRDEAETLEEIFDRLLESRIKHLGPQTRQAVRDLGGNALDKIKFLENHKDLFARTQPTRGDDDKEDSNSNRLLKL